MGVEKIRAERGVEDVDPSKVLKPSNQPDTLLTSFSKSKVVWRSGRFRSSSVGMNASSRVTPATLQRSSSRPLLSRISSRLTNGMPGGQRESRLRRCSATLTTTSKSSNSSKLAAAKYALQLQEEQLTHANHEDTEEQKLNTLIEEMAALKVEMKREVTTLKVDIEQILSLLQKDVTPRAVSVVDDAFVQNIA